MRSGFRRSAPRRGWLGTSLAAALLACGPHHEGDPDGDTGGSSNGGGPSNSGGFPASSGGQSASSGGASATGGAPSVEAGAGGSIDTPPSPPPPPSVTAMTPEDGAFGTTVTVTGAGLGSESRDNVFLIVAGDADELVLTPEDEEIVSWSEDEIAFRVPFPDEGEVSVETPQGSAVAGTFRATWVSVRSHPRAPGASLLSSVSAGAGHVAMLFDTTPATLVHVDPEEALEETVDLEGVVPSSVELYVSEDGLVEGVGISDAAAPELVHLTRTEAGLVAEPTGVLLDATEYALAGGPDGAAAWMRREGGWARARPGASGWEIDRAGIVDPTPNGRLRTAGATSDGALYIAKAVDTGNFFDDMEAPFVHRLAPEADAFEPRLKAGNNTDDYLTSLALDSRGRGVIIRYCGSDVDPFGASSTDYVCHLGALSTDGVQALRDTKESASVRYAFANRTLLKAACGSDGTFRLEINSDDAASEPVTWPCPTVVAVEIDPDGELLPVVGAGSSLHLLRPRPAEEP